MIINTLRWLCLRPCLIFYLLFITLSNVCYSQINLGFDNGKLNKNFHTKQKKQRALKTVEEVKEGYFKVNDSLDAIRNDSALEKRPVNKMDSIQVQERISQLKAAGKDSLITADVLNDTFSGYKDALHKRSSLTDTLMNIAPQETIENLRESMDDVEVDKLVDSKADKLQELNELKGNEITGIEDLMPGQEPGGLEELKPGLTKDKTPFLAAGQFFEHKDRINLAQTNFMKYKKRLAFFKEGSGDKPNSLKGEPLGKRLIWGANVQVPNFKPVISVVSPYIGYKLDKKISVGASVVYSNKFTALDFRDIEVERVSLGYRLYTDYKLVKGFFAHAEYERLHEKSTKINEDSFWTSRAYIGAGRKVAINKRMNLNFLFLADLTHPQLNKFEKDVFQFRVGFGN